MTDFSAQVALGEKLTPVGTLHFRPSGWNDENSAGNGHPDDGQIRYFRRGERTFVARSAS